MKTKYKTAADILSASTKTFVERNKLYKDNYDRIGWAMNAMFPGGMEINTPEDWTRLYFFIAMITKLSRYATNWERGGHKDSVHDLTVYAAMLEAYDDTN